jgi:hypothetical protein
MYTHTHTQVYRIISAIICIHTHTYIPTYDTVHTQIHIHTHMCVYSQNTNVCIRTQTRTSIPVYTNQYACLHGPVSQFKRTDIPVYTDRHSGPHEPISRFTTRTHITKIWISIYEPYTRLHAQDKAVFTRQIISSSFRQSRPYPSIYPSTRSRQRRLHPSIHPSTRSMQRHLHDYFSSSTTPSMTVSLALPCLTRTRKAAAINVYTTPSNITPT